MATLAVVSLIRQPRFSLYATRWIARHGPRPTTASTVWSGSTNSLHLLRSKNYQFRPPCFLFLELCKTDPQVRSARNAILSERSARRAMSTFPPSTEIQSTEELNQIIEQWRLKVDIYANDFKKLLIWMDEKLLITPDAVTFHLLLDRALRLRDREGDALVTILLENLLETMASDVVACATSLSSLPPLEIEKYMYMVINRFVYDAGQIQEAQDCLGRWWTYHELKPERIAPPKPKAYEMVMKGWMKEGEPIQVVLLFQDMLSRENLEAQVHHFEMCLNALVQTAMKSRGKANRGVASDAEAVLLQLSDWLDQNASQLAADGDVDSTGRSSQTRVLQNLAKVVQCWVESREKLAAARVTKILDLVDKVFGESDAVAADWLALAQAYSHGIRSWSFAATARNDSTRIALSKEMKNCDPILQTEALLTRLEDWVDEADDDKQPTEIPLKTWGRIYGSAIAACGSEYDKDRNAENCLQARRLWDRFKVRGYGDPDLDLYNHLFHVFGKMGDIHASRVLWREMAKDPSVDPDLKTFNWGLLTVKNSTIWSSELERLAEAKFMWNHLRESTISPDIVSYNTYLSCFITRLNDLTIAREGDAVFRELIAHRGDRLRRANAASLNIILRIWANLSKHSEVATEREEALRSALTILKEVYTIRSTDELRLRPTSLTIDLVTSLLDTNNIEEEKRVEVLCLLK